MDVVESKWYEMDMSLNDVKNLLSANIKTMSRSFIAAEYYMKYIRDRELFGTVDIAVSGSLRKTSMESKSQQQAVGWQ